MYESSIDILQEKQQLAFPAEVLLLFALFVLRFYKKIVSFIFQDALLMFFGTTHSDANRFF